MLVLPKSQIFFWLLVAFIAGIAIASFIPLPPGPIAVVLAAGACIAAFGIAAPQSRREVIVAGFAVIACAGGLFWFVRADRPPPSAAVLPVGEARQFTGIVVEEPIFTGRSQRLVVETGGVRILVTARSHPAYSYGDLLGFDGRVEAPENFSEDFDYRSYLARDGIFRTMAFPEIRPVSSGHGNSVLGKLFELKAAFARSVAGQFPEPSSSLMLGLLLGERRTFSPELTEALRTTGTSHIVALSGYNITIVADAFVRTLAFFWVPFAWAFWAAALGIVGFTLLTGAAASVVRAAIMGILVLVARRAGRVYQMRNAITLSAAAMLAFDPRLLAFDVAFQLSFLATLGLVYGAPVVERWYERAKRRMIPPARDAGIIREARDRRSGRPPHPFIRDTLVATLAAQLAVLPLIVWYFGTLSLVSPLANLAVLPFIPATMFFGFLTGAVGAIFEPIGWIPATAGWALASYDLAAIAFFARLPFAAVTLSGAGLAALLLVYGAALVRLWRGRRRRHAAG